MLRGCQTERSPISRSKFASSHRPFQGEKNANLCSNPDKDIAQSRGLSWFHFVRVQRLVLPFDSEPIITATVTFGFQLRVYGLHVDRPGYHTGLQGRAPCSSRPGTPGGGRTQATSPGRAGLPYRSAGSIMTIYTLHLSPLRREGEVPAGERPNYVVGPQPRRAPSLRPGIQQAGSQKV